LSVVSVKHSLERAGAFNETQSHSYRMSLIAIWDHLPPDTSEHTRPKPRKTRLCSNNYW